MEGYIHEPMLLILYALFYGVCRLLAFLPLRALYVLSDFLYLILRYVIGYRRKVVLENLRNSFPEKTEQERVKMMEQFYHFMGDLFVETIKMLHISEKEIRRRIHWHNPEILEDWKKKGKNIYFVAGHYGNWEWKAALEQIIPYQTVSLYHPLENRYFDRFYYRLRTQYGAEVVPSNMALRAINKYRSENQPIILFFIADQAPNNATNYWKLFLNQESSIFLGPERLARKYNAAVGFAEVRRMKRGYYEVFITPITENAAETTDYEITDRHVELLEQAIRRAPQYWLWSHRRWKRKRTATPQENPAV
ncbi:MAG: lysophospholipid acyltransferase family protein [Bacteroidales bacterium]|jgi:KDO2-lipid IV(A) lauroyltransferase|nr:lysophospholipid acyltransferase family protein [Bacteroidales bacterium]